MTFTSLSQKGLLQSLNKSLLGESFTLRGSTYTGVIDDITATEMFAAGGSIASEPVSVTFAKRTFTPALNLGEQVTARGKRYTVRQIVSDEVSFTLICDVPDKR